MLSSPFFLRQNSYVLLFHRSSGLYSYAIFGGVKILYKNKKRLRIDASLLGITHWECVFMNDAVFHLHIHAVFDPWALSDSGHMMLKVAFHPYVNILCFVLILVLSLSDTLWSLYSINDISALVFFSLAHFQWIWIAYNEINKSKKCL